MELAYKYSAKSSRGQRIEGIVHAPNKALAYAKLKKGGFLPIRVDLEPMQSLSGVFKTSFNKAELARFYVTLGRRMNNGKSLVDGLESATEYLQDQRLRQSVMMMRQSLLDGQGESQAMQAAGFPRRDTLVIRSTAETGKTGESFLSLGDEISRSEALRRSMASTFRMPAIMAVFMVVFIWAALMFIAPQTLAFLKQTGLKLNFSPLIKNYFELVRLFHLQSIVSSVLYFGVFGSIAWFLRTESFRSFLDRFKTLRNLSMKSDHAALWNSFSLLYDAAVPAKEAAVIVGDSAKRDDSRQAFLKMGRYIESGRSLEDAVAAAGFPQFVVAGVSSAASGGDVVAGLTDMVRNFEEDVSVLTAMLQENAKVFSILAMGAGVLLVFVMTYYPMLASVMSNL
jgi:type II secretory pathway component PulF